MALPEIAIPEAALPAIDPPSHTQATDMSAPAPRVSDALDCTQSNIQPNNIYDNDLSQLLEESTLREMQIPDGMSFGEDGFELEGGFELEDS